MKYNLINSFQNDYLTIIPMPYECKYRYRKYTRKEVHHSKAYTYTNPEIIYNNIIKSFRKVHQSYEWIHLRRQIVHIYDVVDKYIQSSVE